MESFFNVSGGKGRTEILNGQATDWREVFDLSQLKFVFLHGSLYKVSLEIIFLCN